MKCLNCGAELIKIKGKREKKFCNSTCRSNFWQKQQTLKKAKSVKIVSAKIEKEKGRSVAKFELEMPDIRKPEIGDPIKKDRIKQLEQELAHPPKTFSTQVMKHYYFSERQKELNTLRAANKK